LYRNANLPAGPSAMPGTPTATSSTTVRAEDLGTGGYSGYTFLFDPATTPVTNGEKWWLVLDLSEVTNYDKVVVTSDVSGTSFGYGTSGSSWLTNSDGDLMSRVYDALRWDDLDGHGTHTLGSILGNGRQYLSSGQPRYRAAAFEASAVHQSVQDSSGALGGLPYALLPLFEEAHDSGARIHSNSWGSNAHGNYTLDALHADQFMWEHPDCLLLFSAGNDGMDGRWVQPAPQNTEQQLNTASAYHFFKLGSASGYVRAIVLNMRRSSDANGYLYLYPHRDSGGTPTSARYGQYGPIYVSDLPYATGTSADFRPVEFNALYSWTAGYTYWVEVEWSGRTQGDIYVGCDNTGTQNYCYWLGGSSYVFTDQRQAIQLVTGDGKIDTGSIASPATAKNCLAVGSSETDRIPNDGSFDLAYNSDYYSDPIASDSYLNNASGMGAFSSRGPTQDGRYKPDLVAPGTFIASCRSQKIVPPINYDVEQEPSAAWVPDGVWSRTNAYGAHSGSYAYRAAATGSSGSSYLTYGQDIDLLSQYEATWGYTRPFWVHFWANYAFTGTGERLYLWGSANGGATWGGIWSSIIAPDTNGWALQVAPISPTYGNQPDFRFRFELRDNNDGVLGTCLLDDVTVWLTGGWSVRLNDLCAAGWDDYAGNTVSKYEFMTGTSMSCPLTAGVATLVREYYVEKKGLADPPAALIKATMINEAVDMSPGQYVTPQELSARYDNAQGWGRVNAKGCLYRAAPRIGGYVNGVGGAAFTAEGQTQSILLGVPDNAGNTDEPVKVTLAWTDRPGALWASPCLVNNLDLKVEHLTGYPNPPGAADATWYGNNAGAGGDAVNNVEEVDLAAPVTYGWYRISVTCAALPLGGVQPWALVASGGFTNDPGPTPVEVDDLRTSTSAGGGLLLHWKAAAGLGTAEFLVSRSGSTAGPFEVVGRADPGRGDRQCEFEDRSAIPGRSYVYRVEAVDSGGRVLGGDTVSATGSPR
jgi:hypothetical protein